MEPVKKTTIYFPEELSMKEIFQCFCACVLVYTYDGRNYAQLGCSM